MEKFRKVTKRWHWFFEFEEDQSPTQTRRKREGFEADRVPRAARGGHPGGDEGRGADRAGDADGRWQEFTFMLPAFCSPEGVTIVGVPLVPLREDMQRRCEESRIDSQVWKSAAAKRVASIVFATPETAVTKGLLEFVNRLRDRQQLERIVVDECHMVLDCGRDFQQRVRRLGAMLQEIGAQAVF